MSFCCCHTAKEHHIVRKTNADPIPQQSRLSCLYASRKRVFDLYPLHECMSQTHGEFILSQIIDGEVSLWPSYELQTACMYASFIRTYHIYFQENYYRFELIFLCLLFCRSQCSRCATPSQNWDTGHGHRSIQVALANASLALPGNDVFSAQLSPRHLFCRDQVGSTCVYNASRLEMVRL